MKNKSLFLFTGVFVATAFSSFAGPCTINVSPNPYTVNFPVGWTFFANHLNNGGNTLGVLFPNPPDRTVVYKFDPNSGFNSDMYDAGLVRWQSGGTFTLNPGEGAIIYTETAFSQMFNGSEPGDTPIAIGTHSGFHLVARQKGGCLGEYNDIVTPPASEGTGLYRYIGSSDPTFNGFNEIAYNVFYYHNSIWWPSVPIIPAWESVFVGPAPSVVEGTVFADPAGACSGSSPLANWIIKMERVPATPDTTVYGITDASGHYRIFARRGGNYRVSALPKNNWAQTCPNIPNYYSVTVAGFAVFSGKDFWLQNTGGAASDLQVDLVPFFPFPLVTPCCGQGMYYLISYQNIGTSLSPFNNVTVQLVYPPDVTPVSAVPPPVSITSNPLVWPVGSLPFGGSGSIQLGLTVNPCVTPLLFTAQATIGNPNPGLPELPPQYGDNSAFLTEAVVCSYDPNDKQVSPKGCGPTGLIPAGQTLTYFVQFQNLGNGPAYQVVVRDTLDSDLDLSSLELIGSSHRQSFAITGRELIWTFPIIRLPPASSDEPGSHGYVKFKIRPRADITPGIVITNQAAIYFDLNDPVLTVITTNTITQNPVPVASFTVTPRLGSAGFTNDFTYTGGTAGAQFLWIFGPDAIPASSTAQDPAGVVFSSSGFKTATLSVTLQGCESEPAAEILSVGVPQIQTQWDGNQLGLSWKGNGFVLQERSELNSATPWTLSSATVTHVGWTYVANVLIDGSKFFRLGDSAP